MEEMLTGSRPVNVRVTCSQFAKKKGFTHWWSSYTPFGGEGGEAGIQK